MANTRNTTPTKQTPRQVAFDAVPEVMDEPTATVSAATVEPTTATHIEPTIETPEPVQNTKTKPLIAPRRRPKRGEERSNVRSGNKLVAPLWAQEAAAEQGLVLRFVNDPKDTGQRLLDMETQGWSMVAAPEGAERNPGTVSAGEAGSDSTRVSRVVDRVSGERAYLMAMPKDEYDGYQDQKQEKIKVAEEGLRRTGGIQGVDSYGEMKLT